LVRASIGLEDVSDLLADIRQALDACEWKPFLTSLVAPTAPSNASRSRNKRRTISDTNSTA